VLAGKGGDVDAFDAAEVYRNLWECDAFGMCLDAARFAEEMADLLFVKEIFRKIVFA
jgi:hypothetical protein